MMSELYKRAIHVFDCVGLHADESEFLLETLEKRHALFTSIYKHTAKPNTDNLTGWANSNPIPTKRWLACKCFFAMNVISRYKLTQAAIAFLGRPYFSRAWILQELYLASEIFFCCGKDIRSFDSLLAVSALVDFGTIQRA
jgi:hypothetical protein